MRFDLRLALSLGAIASLGLLAGCGENLTHPAESHDAAVDDPDASTLTCIPNLDGQIDLSELKPTLNAQASYLVSPAGEQRKVDLVGTTGTDGNPVWEFSQDFATDQIALIAATELTGKWYASSFPDGQFVTPIDVQGLIEGIYKEDDHAFSLLGIASHDQAPAAGTTLVVYDKPIDLYRFPLKPGDAWVSAGQVTGGMIDGLPYAGKDTYQVEDVAVGTLNIRDFTFTQAHRVKTTVTLQPAAGASQVKRQDSFMFECFGEVVRATSNQGEQNDDFTTAAEVRRLGN